MAMTLRLSDDETAALRRQAEIEGRSMQDIARRSIVEYLERAGETDLDEIIHRNAIRYADVLERLRHS